MIERGIRKGEVKGGRYSQVGLDAALVQVRRGEVELLRCDVDTGQAGPGKLVSEDAERGTRAAADFKQAPTGGQRGSAEDDPARPEPGLIGKTVLFVPGVSVHIGPLLVGDTPHPSRLAAPPPACPLARPIS